MNEQSKSLLVVKVAGRQTSETIEAIRLALDPLAQEIGAKVLVSDSGVDAALHQDLRPLCQQLAALIDAMAKQHSVFCRLVASNEALVQAMAEADGGDQGDTEAPPRVGLNGRPL